MLIENWYLIFLYQDENTGELLGSNKINDFVFFDEIDLIPYFPFIEKFN